MNAKGDCEMKEETELHNKRIKDNLVELTLNDVNQYLSFLKALKEISIAQVQSHELLEKDH